MSDKLTIASVREWLRETNRDRRWLAETLGVSKRTVDNWLTSGDLPLFASQHIRRIMAQEASPGNLRFTLEQWDKIEAARRLAGYEDRTEFFTDALLHYTQSVVSQLPKYVEQLGPGAVIRHKLSQLVGDLRRQHEKPRPAPETRVPDAGTKPPRKRRNA
jgi:hypothetical protein